MQAGMREKTERWSWVGGGAASLTTEPWASLPPPIPPSPTPTHRHGVQPSRTLRAAHTFRPQGKAESALGLPGSAVCGLAST